MKLIFTLSFFLVFTSFAKTTAPKLVVVLVYDQFRSDFLTANKEEFLPAKTPQGAGGFRLLMDEGAYYPFAEYETLQCMTCPGHAMILTGSYPYANGISLNNWIDPQTGKEKYCAEDSEYGLSPRRLKANTVGDELKLRNPKSQVIALALKDRAGIMMGGHTADYAFWLNKNLEWETSRYYTRNKSVPSWLESYNKKLSDRKNEELIWKPIYSKASFEHKAKASDKDSLASPFGGEITTDFALKVVKEMKLGAGEETDFLAISFSTHDIAGHRYGPNAPEMKELTLAEDRQLSTLLNGLQKAVPGGLKNVYFVLTADHGVAPIADYAKSLGLFAGTINQDKLLENLNQKLNEKFGKLKKDAVWFSNHRSFNIYLSEEGKKKRSEVEAFAKELILKEEGVFFVVTRSEIEAGKLPPRLFGEQVSKTFVDDVNGDLIIIPRPFWYEEYSKNKATHMTGYTYDRTVPLIFMGTPWKKGLYGQKAHIADLAPTLSFILGLISPAMSEGRILSESLKGE